MVRALAVLLERSIRVSFQHLLGQRVIRQGRTRLSRFLWKLFLGNRILPRLGGYEYFAAGEFEKIFDWLGLTDQPGYFVEAGACDGFSSSNTKYLELFCGWRGLLIEPYERYARVAQLHRRGSIVKQACLVPKGFPGESVKLRYAGLMTVTLLGDKLAQLHAQADEGARFMSPFDSSHEFLADAITLEAALEEADAPRKIDLISLDLEGVELEVLQDFNFVKWEVRFWLVESREFEETQHFFESNGYSLITNDPKTGMLFRLDRIAEPRG